MTWDMTLPISFGDEAPDSATTSPTIARSSSSESWAGRYASMIAASRCSPSARSVARGLAVGVCGLQAALALALEHGDLVGLAPACLLVRLLELVRDQAQSVHALAVARAHRVLRVGLYLFEQRHVHDQFYAGGRQALHRPVTTSSARSGAKP